MAGEKSLTELDEIPSHGTCNPLLPETSEHPPLTPQAFSDAELEKAAKAFGMTTIAAKKIRGGAKFASLLQQLGLIKAGVGLYVKGHQHRDKLLRDARKLFREADVPVEAKLDLIRIQASVLNDQDNAVRAMLEARESSGLPESAGETTFVKGPTPNVPIQVNISNEFRRDEPHVKLEACRELSEPSNT